MGMEPITERAYTVAKLMRGSSSLLAHFDPNKPILIQCDASPLDAGAVLCLRLEDDSIHP